MLENLKQEVFKANLLLKEYGLVVLTWGNVSAIDRQSGLIVIKPSGVPYETMNVNDMVIVDLEGNVVEGHLKPSSDTPTHIELYKSFKDIGSVVHTHSPWATSFAQAGRNIPAYGTTHADFANRSIPCTRGLTQSEVEDEYEKNTGRVIVERFEIEEISPNDCPAVLIHRHGPFCWGKDSFKAVENALVLEEIAKMAFRTEQLADYEGRQAGIEDYLLDKHYQRKHGKNAYYGQK